MSEEKQQCGYCGLYFLRVASHLKYCKTRIAQEALKKPVAVAEPPVKQEPVVKEPEVVKKSWFARLVDRFRNYRHRG